MDFPQTGQVNMSNGAPNQAASPAPTLSSYATRKVNGGIDIINAGLIFICAIFIFISGLLFTWKFFLEKAIAQKKNTLSSYESRVSSLPLEEVARLSNKMKVANQIVKDYPYVVDAFSLLEDSIENNVVYKSFQLQNDPSVGAYIMSVSAVAPGYKAVARQVDILRTDLYKKYVSNIEVSGISPDDKGNITFTVKTPLIIKGVTPEDLILSTTVAKIATSTPTSGTTVPEDSLYEPVGGPTNP